MTTLVCWSGVDSRGPSSLYIATDSRFTWRNGASVDYGRKILTRPRHGEILAFAGGVLLCQNLFLGLPDEPLSDDLLCSRLKSQSGAFSDGELEGTALVFARRLGSGMSSMFLISGHEYRSGAWFQLFHSQPTEHSKIICAYGTGGPIAKSEVQRWMDQDVSGRTSRSVFSGFCDAIRSGDDPCTGGAPQLSAIYRDRPAVDFGVIWQNRRYRAGIELGLEEGLDGCWTNDLFEICDPSTRAPRPGAQRHARPRTFVSPA